MAFKKLIKKVFGEDKYKIMDLIAKGLVAKTQNVGDHVWADYFFISACYASVQNKDKQTQKLVRQIKRDFPNYDPSKRFTWGRINSSSKESITLDTIANVKAVAPVVGEMNRFCEAHKDFSFEKNFEKYFAGAAKMSIRQDSDYSK